MVGRAVCEGNKGSAEDHSNTGAPKPPGPAGSTVCDAVPASVLLPALSDRGFLKFLTPKTCQLDFLFSHIYKGWLDSSKSVYEWLRYCQETLPATLNVHTWQYSILIRGHLVLSKIPTKTFGPWQVFETWANQKWPRACVVHAEWSLTFGPVKSIYA